MTLARFFLDEQLKPFRTYAVGPTNSLEATREAGEDTQQSEDMNDYIAAESTRKMTPGRSIDLFVSRSDLRRTYDAVGLGPQSHLVRRREVGGRSFARKLLPC